MSHHSIIRGAAHANAMRADKMRALAVKLAAALELLAAAGKGAATGSCAAEALIVASTALADAREAGVIL
jgi:hypothetical protein